MRRKGLTGRKMIRLPYLAAPFLVLCLGIFLAGSGIGRSDAMSFPKRTPTPTPTTTPTPALELPTRINGTLPQFTPLSREPHAWDYLDAGLGSPDIDCDGVRNGEDNCALVFNPKQKRTRSKEYGDACNPRLKNHRTKDLRCDTDADGIYDHRDNCREVANPDQKDSNCDDLGDACDTPEIRAVNLCPSKATKRSSRRPSRRKK
jgi:hypothetical protein